MPAYYHIFNHANGIENLFNDDGNYRFFLQKAKQFLLKDSYCLAYCLMPNHFHLLISTDLSLETLTKLTSNLAISYSKSFNKLYNRKGALFLRKCKLKLIDPEVAVPNVMMYIHRNPVHHRFVNDYEDWPFSSYKEFIANAHVYTSNQNTNSFFDSVENYIARHKAYKDKWELEKSLENFD